MQHFAPHDWLVVDDAFNPDLNRFHETIFYLGNGYMGVRGVPEEGFPAAIRAEKSSPYTFVAPIYDIVPSGGWRVPVRECSVMVKVPDFFPINLTLGGVKFDTLAGKVADYSRTLNMKEGTVVRKLTWEDRRGRRTEFESTRFVSMADRHVAAFRFSFRPLNWTGAAVVEPSIDGCDTGRQRQIGIGGIGKDGAFLCVETLKTGHKTAMAMRTRLVESMCEKPGRGRSSKSSRELPAPRSHAMKTARPDAEGSGCVLCSDHSRLIANRQLPADERSLRPSAIPRDNAVCIPRANGVPTTPGNRHLRKNVVAQGISGTEQDLAA